jgi:hypothetical protein
VDSFFRAYTEICDQIILHATNLSKGYNSFRQTEINRKKAEQEAELRRIAEEQRREAEAAAKEGVKYEPVIPVPVVVHDAPTVTRTETGSVHQREHWDFELEDISKVGREYLMVDEKKVRQAVKDGVRSIPGFKIFLNPTMVVRT